MNNLVGQVNSKCPKCDKTADRIEVIDLDSLTSALIGCNCPNCGFKKKADLDNFPKFKTLFAI